MFTRALHRPVSLPRGALWLLILLSALAAFELFNFATTEYALGTFFGGQSALGAVRWATILAVAFCGIDLAGLSRLSTRGSAWRHASKEDWLLTAAWFFGALMNAAMTWWAVAATLAANPGLGNELVTRQQILQIVPLAVAGLVWLTRVTLIGSIAGGSDHLLSGSPRRDMHAGATISGTARSLEAARSGNPSLPRPVENPAHASSARASSVRSTTPLSRPAGDRYQPAAWQASSFAAGQRPASSPAGERAAQTAAQHELTYVNLD